MRQETKAGIARAAPDPSLTLGRLPELKSFGVSVFDPVWAVRVHRDPEAELLFMVHGEMELELGGRRFPMPPGQMALVPPDLPHRDLFGHDEEPEIFMAKFTWEAGAGFFAEVANEDLAALPEHERSENTRIVSQLRDPELADTAWDRAFANSLLHSLLLRIWRAVRNARVPAGEHRHGAARRTRLMELARQYLDDHFHEEVTLDKLAKKLKVSAFHLSRVFSQESGFSLISYLTSVRMTKAREKLQAREGNVSEVAFAVGYENSAYFSRVFKRHYGVSPSDVAIQSLPPRR